MRPVPLRSFAAFFAGTLLVISSTTLAFAAITLAGVRVDPQPGGGASVSIAFGGGVPSYHVVGAGTTETTIVFENTAVAPQAPPAVGGAGPITSVTVLQTGTSTSVALHLAAATKVRVRPAGSTLLVEVAANTPAPAAALTPTLPQPSTAPAGATDTIVVPLKYADVSEVAGVLVANSNVASNDTFAPAQSNIGTSQLNGTFGGVGGVNGAGGFQAPAPPAQNFGGLGQTNGVAQRLNDNVAIDRRLNAVILTGTPDVIAGMRSIIDKLDIPVPSVLLETQVVELSDTAARNIGLDLSPDGSGIVVNGSNSGSGSGGNGVTIRNGGSVGTTTGGGTTTNGNLGAQVSLSANLYAQISSGNARVIAKPRILAQSGQQASILTGDALPILTSVTISGGSAVTSQQVNYVNVGVNLQIQPRVSSDGFVTSHIYTEVSSVTNFVQGAPQISQRVASTIATVRDGESFVIGGLLQDNEIRNLTKLPFIGDIPIIGVFFRHVSTSKTQTNLYIVVTPRVVGQSNPPPPPPPGIPILEPSPLPQSSAPPPPSSPAPQHTSPAASLRP